MHHLVLNMDGCARAGRQTKRTGLSQRAQFQRDMGGTPQRAFSVTGDGHHHGLHLRQ